VTVSESLLESRGPGPATVCESGRSWQRAGSVHGGRPDKGYDAPKNISWRKGVGIVDTPGLLSAVVAVGASTRDHVRWQRWSATLHPRPHARRVFWHKSVTNSFAETLEAHQVVAEVARRSTPAVSRFYRTGEFERTWSRLMNSRRLQIDHERLPVVAESVV